jgi:hypothetical protein
MMHRSGGAIMNRSVVRFLFVVGASIMWTSLASAGLDPATKCAKIRLKVAGQYVSCLLRAEAKALKLEVAPDVSKCDSAFSKRWNKSEQQALNKGVACPSLFSNLSDVDVVAYTKGRLTRLEDSIEALIRGIRFVDNGDGTITDYLTNLMWEKKEANSELVFWTLDSGCLHCPLTFMDWYTAMGDWLAAVNGLVATVAGEPGPQVGLGGHSDWRLPTVAELQTLGPVLSGSTCGGSPCNDPSLFGPTAYFDTVTSSLWEPDPERSCWYVNFQVTPGFVGVDTVDKDSGTLLVRAVRTLP